MAHKGQQPLSPVGFNSILSLLLPSLYKYIQVLFHLMFCVYLSLATNLVCTVFIKYVLVIWFLTWMLVFIVWWHLVHILLFSVIVIYFFGYISVLCSSALLLSFYFPCVLPGSRKENVSSTTVKLETGKQIILTKHNFRSFYSHKGDACSKTNCKRFYLFTIFLYVK